MRFVPEKDTQLGLPGASSHASCLCGEIIEPTLGALGSLWCRDCRDDARLRNLALERRHSRGRRGRSRRPLGWPGRRRR
jgi:hypothetical protein